MGETKVFVGNVNFKATKDELSDFFSDCRAIREVAIILDRDTRRSKGYAFIIFTDIDAAKDAVTRMDGKDFQGRPLKVRVADNQDNNRSFKGFDDGREPAPNNYNHGGYGDMHPGSYGGGGGYRHGDYGSGYGSYGGRGEYNYSYGGGDSYSDYYRRNERHGYSNERSYYNY